MKETQQVGESATSSAMTDLAIFIIRQLGIREISSVGLSYIGQEGRLVCSDPYVDCVVDFNKNVSGYESGIVGEKSGFQPSNIGSSEGILREELVT